MVENAPLDSPMSPAEAFREAVARIGSQTATGRLLEMTQQAISERLSKGLPCPGDNFRVLKVEAATGISRHALRPDIYPPEPIAPRADDEPRALVA